MKGVICDDPVILFFNWPYEHCATTALQCSQGMLVADFAPSIWSEPKTQHGERLVILHFGVVLSDRE